MVQTAGNISLILQVAQNEKSMMAGGLKGKVTIKVSRDYFCHQENKLKVVNK